VSLVANAGRRLLRLLSPLLSAARPDRPMVPGSLYRRVVSGLSSQRLRIACCTMNANRFRTGSGQPDATQPGVGIGHAGAVRLGLDGRTVAIGLFAVVLAVVLGAVAGSLAGAGAGVLAALAGLVPPAVLALAVELRQRNIARMQRRQEVLRRFAPPKPTGDREGEE
jgi:hypothetical protein